MRIIEMTKFAEIIDGLVARDEEDNVLFDEPLAAQLIWTKLDKEAVELK